jgi:hypothetical protein
MTEPDREYNAVAAAAWLKCPLQCQHSSDNGRVSLALGEGDVVAVSMSGRLLDLDRRRVRVGREEGTMAAVRSMGATSGDAGSISFVCSRGGNCCAVRGIGLV